MTLTLTPQTEAKLLAWAEYEGQEADIVADVLLADALARRKLRQSTSEWKRVMRAASVHILNSRLRCELSITCRRICLMKKFSPAKKAFTASELHC